MVRRKGGFTLVELLVVISIIGLLISLLLPSLSGAKVAARTSLGIANQRGLMQATAVYGADNKDMLMPASTMAKRAADGYTWGRFFTRMTGAASDYTVAGGTSLPRPGQSYIYADALMDGGYVTDSALFSDPGKEARIPDGVNDTAVNGNRSKFVDRKGIPAARTNTIGDTTGAAVAAYQDIGFGCSYYPSSIWYTEAYGGSVNQTATGYWDKGPITGTSGTINARITKYPTIGRRPYPSENMWLMDYNGTNQPVTVQMLGSYNYAPFRNGSAVHTEGTTAAVFFDGHAGVFRNVDIYPYRLWASLNASGSPLTSQLTTNVGMMATPWGPAGATSYWPDPSIFPNFIGGRFWDSRNVNPLGGANNFSGVDAQNVAMNLVTP